MVPPLRRALGPILAAGPCGQLSSAGGSNQHQHHHPAPRSPHIKSTRPWLRQGDHFTPECYAHFLVTNTEKNRFRTKCYPCPLILTLLLAGVQLSLAAMGKTDHWLQTYLQKKATRCSESLEITATLTSKMMSLRKSASTTPIKYTTSQLTMNLLRALLMAGKATAFV